MSSERTFNGEGSKAAGSNWPKAGSGGAERLKIATERAAPFIKRRWEHGAFYHDPSDKNYGSDKK